MIARAFRALPGPLPLRAIVALVVIAGGLVGLHFFYDWLGTTFLDPGGGVG